MNPKIIAGIVAVIIITGASVWYFKKTESVTTPVLINKTAENNTNQAQTPMNTIDPKAQALVDQYNELAQKLSDAAKKGDPTEADEKIFDQLSAISADLMKFDMNRIQAILNAYSYGYDISISINGKDTGVSGGGSSASRLFNSDSLMARISTPDVVAQNFILNKGENTIIVKYNKKNKENSEEKLTVSLTSYDNNDVILSIDAKNKTEGTIEKTFILELAKPADFKTVSVEE